MSYILGIKDTVGWWDVIGQSAVVNNVQMRVVEKWGGLYTYSRLYVIYGIWQKKTH